ncbi:MAG: hypothetical protein Q4D94_14060, partial [Bacillota bacterium]|nr:hypothetical protein [Bacillota bacterium]
MFDIFVSIVTNSFRLYVTKRFMELFFRKDEVNKNKELIVYFLFFGLTTVVHIMFQNPILNMLINLLGLYIITLVYESKHMIKVLVVALIYIINMVCDILSVFLLGNYNIGGSYEITAAFVTVLLILLCELIIERILHRDQINVVDIKHWKILIIVPISSIIILCATVINPETNRIFTVIESVGILIINIVIFYLYGELKKYYFTLEENLFFKQRTEAYAAQLDILV